MIIDPCLPQLTVCWTLYCFCDFGYFVDFLSLLPKDGVLCYLLEGHLLFTVCH